MRIALRTRLGTGVLAKEVVLGHGSKRGMGVSPGCHSKFIRVDTKFLLKLQSDFQGRARILILKHFLLFDLGTVQVGFIPGFVVCKLIVW